MMMQPLSLLAKAMRAAKETLSRVHGSNQASPALNAARMPQDKFLGALINTVMPHLEASAKALGLNIVSDQELRFYDLTGTYVGGSTEDRDVQEVGRQLTLQSRDYSEPNFGFEFRVHSNGCLSFRSDTGALLLSSKLPRFETELPLSDRRKSKLCAKAHNALEKCIQSERAIREYERNLDAQQRISVKARELNRA
jgi:hypothetical protein